MWILVACAAIGTGIGLVVRHVRSDDGSGPKPIRVRPARPGPHSAAGLWLFGATTVRLDPTTLSDPRDVGFPQISTGGLYATMGDPTVPSGRGG